MKAHQNFPKFAILALVALLVSPALSDLQCPDPQKGIYMSYNALSKRDTIPNLFTTINAKIPLYNDSYTNTTTSKVYSFTDMHPQMYYSEHHQKESYVGKHFLNLDSQHVNVTLGDIELAFRLNYHIKEEDGSNRTGSARGRVLVDQTAYFVKRLLIKDGFLEWDPT